MNNPQLHRNAETPPLLFNLLDLNAPAQMAAIKSRARNSDSDSTEHQMPISFTQFGRAAISRMVNLSSMALFIPGDNAAFNQGLHEAHQQRKADTLNRMKASLGPGCEHVVISYDGEDGAARNAPYTAELSRFVAESVVCSCVDTYHWYLRRLFEASLMADRSQITEWSQTLGISQKKVDEILATQDLKVAISSIFRGREVVFRKLAHKYLHVPDLSVIPKAVILRNCLVHELGHDRTGDLAEAIAVENDLGVQLVGEVVTVSVGAAYDIAGRFIADVSIMDQCLARVLSIPTDTTPITPFSRAYS
jgi:hypothetical protein